MSEVRLVVRDAYRDLSGTVHGSTGDRLIAALSADPETIEELEAALARFEKPWRHGVFSCFRRGIDDEPWDAGLLVIDLAARLIVCESSYSYASTSGTVDYHNGEHATDIPLSYSLADEWKSRDWATDWQAEADRRRRERLTRPALDARAVLYGRPALEHFATEVLSAYQRLAPTLPPDRELGPDEWQTERSLQVKDAIRDVHRAWLMTPREDLRGQSPREVLFARQKHIGRDLQNRSDQWTRMLSCPPVLSEESHAFTYGGMGFHEWVIYYYGCRELLHSCWDELERRAATGKPSLDPLILTRGDFLPDEAPRLERVRERWLDTPDGEYWGRTPRQVIDNERARRPEGSSPREHVVDCDCPLCQMTADLPGPMFWGLDGCNMDDEFAFSSYDTVEEWEEEQRRWAEFNAKFNAKWKARQAEREALGFNQTDSENPQYLWKSSSAASDSPDVPVGIRLFQLGANLAELIVDLKEPSEDRASIDQLLRDWGNLREVVQSGQEAYAEALFEPVLDRFCETLVAVGTSRPDLDQKCQDLQGQLRGLLKPPPVYDPNDDDGYPF